MKSTLLKLACLISFAIPAHAAIAAQENVRVGWCTTSFNVFTSPFAVAKKMGYDAEEGISVDLVPVASGSDCVKFIATGEFPYAVPSIEPLAGIVAQGLEAKEFYNFYNGTGFGIAVPVDSDIKTIADLRGKKIGVLALTAVGYSVARGLVKAEGMNPDSDITIVNVGETQRAALALQNHEVDAISLFETAHITIGSMIGGVRMLDAPALIGAPQGGFVAKADYFADHKDEAVALGRMYSKASAFIAANPSAALDILYEAYPQLVPTGRDLAEVKALDLDALSRRLKVWDPAVTGLAGWGRINEEGFDRYLALMADWGMTSRPVKADEFTTNELIDQINDFDQAAIVAQAKAYPGK